MSNRFCCKTTDWDLSLWQQGAAHSWQHSQISWARVTGSITFLPEIHFVSPSALDFFFFLVLHFGINKLQTRQPCVAAPQSPSSSGEQPLSEEFPILISLCFSPWVRAIQVQSALTCVRNGLLLHMKISWLNFWKWWSFSPLHPQRIPCLAPSPAHCWMAVSAIPACWLNSWKRLKCTSDQISLNIPAWATSMLWLHTWTLF